MSESSQQIIVWVVLGLAAAGILIMGSRAIRSLLRGRCASRCAGCETANEAGAPKEPQELDKQPAPTQRIAFIPAGNLRNSSKERGM